MISETLFLSISGVFVLSFLIACAMFLLVANKVLHLVSSHLERLQGKVDILTAAQAETLEFMRVISRKLF